jgi:hypothetical protein
MGTNQAGIAPDDPGHFHSVCDTEHSMEPALDVGFHCVFNEDWHDGSLRIPFARHTFFRDGGFGLPTSPRFTKFQSQIPRTAWRT